MIKHKCVVCGNDMILDECNVCEICDWEDDVLQEAEPDYRGGANPDSLNERKQWWEQHKVEDLRKALNVNRSEYND